MPAEKYVSVAEVRDLLEAEAEARGYESLLASQKATLDHAQKTCSITPEQAEAIRSQALAIDFVSETAAIKIADLLPEYPEEVRAIFYKERVNLDAEKIEAVLDVVRRNV